MKTENKYIPHIKAIISLWRNGYAKKLNKSEIERLTEIIRKEIEKIETPKETKN